MGDELRLRRLQLQEAKKGVELKRSLGGLVCHDFHSRDELPEWIHVEIKRFLKMDSDPDVRIGKNEKFDRVNWIRGFLDRVDVGKRFYLLTPLDLRPWLDCEIRTAEWLENVMSVGDPTVNVILVSSDFMKMLAIFEVEYELIGFAAYRDPVDRG